MVEIPKLPPVFSLEPLGLRSDLLVAPWDDQIDDPTGEVVFIASPWACWSDRPGQEREVKREYAKALGRWAIEEGLAPFVPVLQSDAMGFKDEIQEHRDKCIRVNDAMQEIIPRVIVGVDGGVTPGMMREAQRALKDFGIAWWVSLPTWSQTFRQCGFAVDWKDE